MEMPAAESNLLKSPKMRWLAREKESGRIYDWATVASSLLLVAMLAVSATLLQ